MKLVVLKHLGMKGKTAAAPQTGSEVIPQLGSMFERDEALMRVVSFSCFEFCPLGSNRLSLAL